MIECQFVRHNANNCINVCHDQVFSVMAAALWAQLYRIIIF